MSEATHRLIAVAAVALKMSQDSKPPGLHFGWTDMDLMTASCSYFAFGEGNVPWKVRELIVRAEPNPERRPRVVIRRPSPKASQNVLVKAEMRGGQARAKGTSMNGRLMPRPRGCG